MLRWRGLTQLVISALSAHLLLSIGLPSAYADDGAAAATDESVQATETVEPVEATETPAAPEAAPATTSTYDLLTTKHLLGDWGGLRTDLDDAGVSFKFKVMNQCMVNMNGGKETSNGVDLAGSYELNLYFDFEKMNLIPGAQLFIRGKGTWGGDASDFDKEKVGGTFKTNADASAEEPIFVDKWWWTQKFGDTVEMRLGRLQPTKDLFDTSTVMGDEDTYFMNAALVTNPVLPGHKGLGAYANVNLTDWLYVRMAGIDANSRDRRTNFDTAFHDDAEYRLYAETGVTPKFETAGGPLKGHYRVGTWYEPTRKAVYFDDLGGRLETRYKTGEWGFFCGFDQKIWNEGGNEKQGLSLAGRYGHAPENANKLEHFWAVAAKYDGPIPGRDKDFMGFGVAQGVFSDDLALIGPAFDRETVYELYYSIDVAPWLAITPDLQYITNTGGKKADPNTAVFGLRLRIML